MSSIQIKGADRVELEDSERLTNNSKKTDKSDLGLPLHKATPYEQSSYVTTNNGQEDIREDLVREGGRGNNNDRSSY